jgi:hypothetical protein
MLCLLGYSMSSLLLLLQNFIPSFLIHVNSVLINRLHTQLSYYHVGVDVNFSYIYVATSWRDSSDSRTEKSVCRELTFVILEYFPVILKHLSCKIWRFLELDLCVPRLYKHNK